MLASRARDPQKGEKDTMVPLFSSRVREEMAFGVRFQYFGHIAEVRESRRAETGSPEWDAWGGRRSRVFFPPLSEDTFNGKASRPPPSAKELARTNLPREASNSSKTSRRSPDEAFFSIYFIWERYSFSSELTIRSTFYYTLRRKSRLIQNTFSQQ